ncbi:MAG: sporulation protein YunB [Oscillospiraceae bacterium]|nr:sporulation protein YunB [Oscillospiraceae bacterium]
MKITDDAFYKNKKHKKNLIIYRIIFFLLINLIILVLLDINFRPIIKNMSEYHGKLLAVKSINQAVFNEINKNEYDSLDLVNFSKDINGNIIGVNIDNIGINRIQSRISYAIVENILEIKNHKIKIRLGTLLGSHIFSGRGPEMDFIIVPNGNVSTNITSEFNSAGINQTNHKISLNIEVNISVIIPWHTTRVTVPSNFILSDTIIVGNVPESFTEVITSEKEIEDIINDYSN